MQILNEEKAGLIKELEKVDTSLAELWNEEVQLIQLLNNIRNQRQDIVGQRKRIVNAIKSGIYMLPNELLCHIFLFTADHPDPGIFQRRANVLTHVCHRWRIAAIAEPRLWRYIDLKEGKPFEKTQVYLDRSGACPITVNLDLTHQQLFDQYEKNFLLMRIAPHLSRCDTFSISTKRTQPLLLTLPRFTTRPAPHLESFEVYLLGGEVGKGWVWPDFVNKDGSKAIEAFAGHAPKLKSMTISGMHVPWKSFNIHSLTEFSFDFHSTDVRRSLGGFLDILNASPNLRKLTIMQAGSGLRVRSDWLADLTLDQRLARVSLGIGKSDLPKFQKVTLPKVEELVVTFAETGLAYDMFNLVLTPNIRTLTIEYIKNDCASLLELMTGPPALFPMLTNLRLVGLTSIAPGRMLNFLRFAARNVTTLHVNAVNCPTLKEIAFLLRWMAMERQEILLPRLQEISSEGLSPRNLREMIQSRPQTIRPKKIKMRRRDWVVPHDECMSWLREQASVDFVEGSSDVEDEDDDDDDGVQSLVTSTLSTATS